MDQAPMNEFSFSNTFEFTEREYVDLHSAYMRKSRTLGFCIFIAFGLLCLLSTYTILIGIVILAMAIMTLFAPHIFKGTLPRAYRDNRIIRAETNYGVNELGVTAENTFLSVKINWNDTMVWEERNGWLRVTSAGFHPFWFTIPELKRAGVYEHVIECCNKHARRFR